MTLQNDVMVLGLGCLAGFLLTLMDRIDEHHIIERYRALLAYIAGIGTAASMAWSIEQYPVLYPFLFGMCVEWIVKDKIDFPSHVFFLFLLTLYFGWRIDLLMIYVPYAAMFVVLRWVSGVWLKRRLAGTTPFFRWYYTSYWEKFVCSMILAASLFSLAVVNFAIGFPLACLYTKRLCQVRGGGG